MSPWPNAPRPNHRLIIINEFPMSSKPMGSPCTQASLHPWATHGPHMRVGPTNSHTHYNNLSV
ncbi:hypothetical protein GIB67_021457 [Kingdonia uniflora]|uniref:Uncharacterized protein n=1 Tax=Kingdonia uniflora TaxID=39325 RepID=A0A7J7NR73_9MAGN|nr:hypothetical protein GIB67_021457 [Kingdonia uniflora]